MTTTSIRYASKLPAAVATFSRDSTFASAVQRPTPHCPTRSSAMPLQVCPTLSPCVMPTSGENTTIDPAAPTSVGTLVYTHSLAAPDSSRVDSTTPSPVAPMTSTNASYFLLELN